jgi:hypothetical protein
MRDSCTRRRLHRRRHPGSFIALDGVEHAITDEHQARHVATLIATRAEPYLPDRRPDGHR